MWTAFILNIFIMERINWIKIMPKGKVFTKWTCFYLLRVNSCVGGYVSIKLYMLLYNTYF